MRKIRIYYPHALSSGSRVRLEDSAANHVSNVLRLRVGDELHLFNGSGGEYQASLVSCAKRQVEVELGEFHNINIESNLHLHLGQGISRGERMDMVMQKATELGVSEITPLITARCNVKLDAERWQKRWQHWQAICISACEQSGRNTLPIIHQPIFLSDWQPDDALRLVLSHRATQKLTEMQCPNQRVQLLIGPEGGLSEEEIQQAMKQQFQALNLGDRILRTETAALTALSLLQYRWGDMQ